MELSIDGLSDEQLNHLVPDGLILLTYRGSLAHGLYEPGEKSIDDIDYLGTYIAGIDHYLGFGSHPESVTPDITNGHDFAHHELRKVVQMLLGLNPNALALLFVPDRFVLYSTPEGERLRANRDAFLSLKGYGSFYGYARSEYERFEKTDEEMREIDELTDLHEQLKKEGRDPEAIESGDKDPERLEEERYAELASRHYAGYMGVERRSLVREHGYDPKSAAHLIRLLRMGREFLIDETINYHRPDADELRAIKNGEWSIDDIRQEAQSLLDEGERLREQSELPDEPDHDRIESLLVNLIRDHHNL